MIQADKKKKINWNRRLQLGLQAYREFLQSVHAMETLDDDDIKALVAKLKSNIFYVVEYREIILQLLLSYNENHFTRYVYNITQHQNLLLMILFLTFFSKMGFFYFGKNITLEKYSA